MKQIMRRLKRKMRPLSQWYWELRYALGGTSGAGSYGKLATFKAETLNAFVAEHDVDSVVEFGCGDGAQLSLAEYPSYIGLDVSPTAIEMCKERFRHDGTKSFFLYEPACFVDRHGLFKADLALSLDVIYHLIEDEIYELYMQHLFGSARRYVAIYSSDVEERNLALHVKHRPFTGWIEANLEGWRLAERIQNDCEPERHLRPANPYDFYIYERVEREQPQGRRSNGEENAWRQGGGIQEWKKGGEEEKLGRGEGTG